MLFPAEQGVVEDKSKAVRWIRSAAAKGHSAAQKQTAVAENDIARPKAARR
jgi:TPR repeat protein